MKVLVTGATGFASGRSLKPQRGLAFAETGGSITVP